MKKMRSQLRPWARCYFLLLVTTVYHFLRFYYDFTTGYHFFNDLYYLFRERLRKLEKVRERLEKVEKVDKVREGGESSRTLEKVRKSTQTYEHV